MKTTTKIPYLMLVLLISCCVDSLGNCINPVKYQSVKSGSFTDQATWSPRGIPTACDSIIINATHTVNLNIDFNLGQQEKGFLLIMPRGSLNTTNNRSLVLNDSCTLENNGTVTVKNITANGPKATVINNSTMYVNSIGTINNNSVLKNSGYIQIRNDLNIDAAHLKNESWGNVIVYGNLNQTSTSVQVPASVVDNLGWLSVWRNYTLTSGKLNNLMQGNILVSTDMVLSNNSNNVVVNQSTISVNRQLTSSESARIFNYRNFFVARDFNNNGFLYNNEMGLIMVIGNLYNNQATGSMIINDGGHVEVDGDLTNNSLIQGALGTFAVTGYSENRPLGEVNGTVDICDKSSSNGGQFDLNSGRVEQGVTFCRGIMPLPVTLLSFHGKAVKGKALLSWRTASEKDSESFIIERSADGKEFKAVGKVAAAGNSQQLQVYEFSDSEPLESVTYYRLKQLDMDGTFAYSHIISLQAEKPATAFEAYPNPIFNGQALNVKLSNLNKSSYELEILDNTGRQIYKQHLEVNQTTVQLELPEVFTNARAGLYALRLIDLTTREISLQKLIVQ